MPQVEDVADRLHSAAIQLLRRASEHDGDSGLTAARLSALSVVVFRGPIAVGALAAAEGVRSATMTGIVNGLEQEGLVQRTVHSTDRRAVLVEPTGKGRRRLARARARRIDGIAGRLTGLADDDLAVLRRAAELIDERFARHRWEPARDREGSRPNETGPAA